jgi:hypothetical protein
VLLPGGFTYFTDHPLSTTIRVLGALTLVALLTAAVLALVRRHWTVLLLCVSVLLWAGFIVASRETVTQPSARYVEFALPALATLAALALSRIRAGWILCALLALYTATSLSTVTSGFAARAGAPFGAGVTRVTAFLEQQHRTEVDADYWASYVIDMSSGGRLTVAALVNDRYPPWQRAARAAADTTFVVFAGMPNDTLLTADTGRLPAFTRVVVGPYAVYLFDAPVDFADLPALQLY